MLRSRNLTRTTAQQRARIKATKIACPGSFSRARILGSRQVTGWTNDKGEYCVRMEISEVLCE